MLSVSGGNATATLHLSNKFQLSNYINDHRLVTFLWSLTILKGAKYTGNPRLIKKTSSIYKVLKKLGWSEVDQYYLKSRSDVIKKINLIYSSQKSEFRYIDLPSIVQKSSI